MSHLDFFSNQAILPADTPRIICLLVFPRIDDGLSTGMGTRELDVNSESSCIEELGVGGIRNGQRIVHRGAVHKTEGRLVRLCKVSNESRKGVPEVRLRLGQRRVRPYGCSRRQELSHDILGRDGRVGDIDRDHDGANRRVQNDLSRVSCMECALDRIDASKSKGTYDHT